MKWNRIVTAVVVSVVFGLMLAGHADAKKPANPGQPPVDPPEPIANPALVYAERFKHKGLYATELFVMTADGSESRQLTQIGDPKWHPAWKPDGTRVAFVSAYEDPTGPPRCYVIGAVNADGTGETVLWDMCADPYIVEIDTGSHDRLDWSAENQIAFSAGAVIDGVPIPEHDYGIWSLDPDTGVTQNVFPLQSSWELWEGSTHLVLDRAESPTWSPDGRLAFVGGIWDDAGAWVTNDIFVFDPSSGVTSNLTYSPGESRLEEAIDWSPDGQYITYNGPGGIYKLSPSGLPPGQLVLTSGRKPHLSPESLYLAFTDTVVTRKGSVSDLFRADADGQNLVNLTDDDNGQVDSDWNPAWENDLDN